MSARRSRFDIPLDAGLGAGPEGGPERGSEEGEPVATVRRARRGPMGVAGREVAENVVSATEAQVEARRRNAAEARDWRAAQAAGRVIAPVPLDAICIDDLPRDRLALDEAATSDEMDELKASIRAHGQREPLALYRDVEGRLQLESGWRRLTALKALHAETGEARFAQALCRIAGTDAAAESAAAGGARLARYVAMVEENAVREDLSFAEMAALALTARDDPACGLADAEEAVSRLYGALHKMKRSNIRRFVDLLVALGDALKWPKAVGRDLGAGVGRRLGLEPALADMLRARLRAADGPEAQNAILADALRMVETLPAAASPAMPVPPGPRKTPTAARRVACGDVVLSLRGRDCRFTLPEPVEAVDEARLRAAVAAFRAALAG